MSLLSKTIETDYLGTYTRYVYDNGHVETDPAGRPIFREDAQRLAGQAARDELHEQALFLLFVVGVVGGGRPARRHPRALPVGRRRRLRVTREAQHRRTFR